MFNITVFILNLAALIASLTWLLLSKELEPLVTSIGLLVSQVLFTKELLSRISLFFKEIPVNISIMGDKYCGKSVFITSAFNQLHKRIEDISVSISDYNTIERVFSDINSLRSSQWLSVTIPSSLSSVFCYQTEITYKNRVLSKRFIISIADFSGEEYETLSSENTDSGWFHSSSYFRYVLNSDVIFLSIDVSAIKSTKELFVHDVNWQIQRIIAAMHVYIKEKKLKPEGKIHIPVCLFFMKSDLISDEERTNIEKTIFIDLIDFCKSKCCKFQVFWVTSTGSLNKDGTPPTPLMPQNVVEPILWAVSNL